MRDLSYHSCSLGQLRLIRFSTKLLKWKAVSVLGSVQVGDEERPLPAVLRP